MYDTFEEPAVVVGEEIYWRAWVVIRSGGWRLRSTYTRFIYENKPFYGYSPFHGQPHGVYAVFTKEQARRVRPIWFIKYATLIFIVFETLALMPFKLDVVHLTLFGLIGALAFGMFFFLVLVANEGYIAVGQIAAWGDIVKHERGVRVEYARVISIYKVYGAPWGLGWYVKRQLRKYYCPNA